MFVNWDGENPEPNEDEALNEALLHNPESDTRALPPAPPPQHGVLYCRLPGHPRQLKWWLTKLCENDVGIFYMNVEMGNDEHTEMQLKL